MDWIWQNVSDERKFVLEENISPYFEIYGDNENQNMICVNPLIRFGSIFRGNEVISFLMENTDVCNAVFRNLAIFDRMNGLSYKETVINIISREIEKGVYGEEIKELFFSDILDDSERKKILSYMYRYHVDGEIKCLISEVFFDIFGKNIGYDEKIVNFEDISASCIVVVTKGEPEIYYSKDKDRYYFYCGKGKKEEKKFRLLKLLFADVEDDIFDMYNHCFGVVGEEKENFGVYPVMDDTIMI